MFDKYYVVPLTSYLSEKLKKLTYAFNSLKHCGLHFELRCGDIFLNLFITDYNYIYDINITIDAKIVKCKIIFDIFNNSVQLLWYIDSRYKVILDDYTDEHLSNMISMTVNYTRII